MHGLVDAFQDGNSDVPRTVTVPSAAAAEGLPTELESTPLTRDRSL